MTDAKVYGLTSKMSHDRGWRAACIVTIWIPSFHSRTHEDARGVTAMVVGSGALLGIFQEIDEDPDMNSNDE